MPARDSKASLGEWVLASPVHDGPIKGKEIKGIREDGFVECSPERRVGILRGAKVGGGVGRGQERV